jgi:hypothetical protein
MALILFHGDCPMELVAMVSTMITPEYSFPS